MKAGSRSTKQGSSDWFAGTVWQNSIVKVPEPTRVRPMIVAFEPVERTAWRTHPLGRTMHAVGGVGIVGLRNERPQVIKAVDTVCIPPGKEQWHGATTSNSMAHIAIQKALNVRIAEWLEKVPEEDHSSAAE